MEHVQRNSLFWERMQPFIDHSGIQQLRGGVQLVVDQYLALGSYVPQLVVQKGDCLTLGGEARDHGHGGGGEADDLPVYLHNIIGQDLRTDAAFAKRQVALIGPKQGPAQ